MSDVVLTADALRAGKRKLSSLRNSKKMLAAVAKVKASHSDAAIVSTKAGMFKLRNNVKDLSSEHNSHYDCWLEAAGGL